MWLGPPLCDVSVPQRRVARAPTVCCVCSPETCGYKRTLPSCTLYITASQRRTVPGGTSATCRLQCEKTLVGALPCWGFTITASGCVLHYQSAQPHCDVTHHSSSAFFRTCFQSQLLTFSVFCFSPFAGEIFYVLALSFLVFCFISKLDRCEGGSFSPTIFQSDIELSVYHIWCFISVCPFVALSKAKFAANVHIVFF